MNDLIWRIDTLVNPRNDYVEMLADPEEKGKPVGQLFILHQDITLEVRRDYPMKILRDTLKEQFKR